MKRLFWFKDNWSGNIKEYNTLKEAIAAAAYQTGETVFIHSYRGKIYEVNASGVTYS